MNRILLTQALIKFLSGIIMLGYIPVIAKRIRNEEKVLAAGLHGYKEYQARIPERQLRIFIMKIQTNNIQNG